jgi:hypothetical protein
VVEQGSHLLVQFEANFGNLRVPEARDLIAGFVSGAVACQYVAIARFIA